jgi:alpha/beta superfamily hydrolase
MAASDRSTLGLRALVSRWGYASYGWGLGRNVGRADGLRQRLDEISERHDRPVSLIGQSLGGVFARELARRQPASVRQVITLASPFRAVNPAPPPVPTTAIYSRSDGVVAWEACIDDTAPGHENVEVDTSHIGMGVHPAVMVVIARRLARRVAPSPV